MMFAQLRETRAQSQRVFEYLAAIPSHKVDADTRAALIREMATLKQDIEELDDEMVKHVRWERAAEEAERRMREDKPVPCCFGNVFDDAEELRAIFAGPATASMEIAS